MDQYSDYLRETLRQSDADRYLLSLFAPASVRPALWALFCFNAEIAKTRDVVTDMNLGLIRLKWWHDEIGKLYGGGTGGQNPILSTLAPAIHQQILPQALFEDLLYAREFDLEDATPETMDGLMNYARFTTAPLNALALKLIGEEASEEEIRLISTNFGLLHAIRSVPYMLSHARCFLPVDLLAKENLTPRKVIDFNHQKEISKIVQTTHSAFKRVSSPQSRFLKIQQRMTFIYLNKIEKHGFDVFCPAMQVPPAFLALRLWFAAL